MFIRLFRVFCVSLVANFALQSSFADEQSVSCDACHADRAKELGVSVHHVLKCRECHGGDEKYVVDSGDVARFASGTASSGSFDHGDAFKGRPSRLDIPDLCGECHADVERMNPYGIRTDQLARYKTSGHGKALYGKQDTKVAVCIDCHGPPHDVRRADDPNSMTYPLNVPKTCGRCHANAALMGQYGLPTEVVQEYKASVHGKLLIDQGDTGAPTCASCHGNHSAMPPGFATVGAVCGQCHSHVAEYFATSVHASEPDHKGCVQCHGGGEGRHYHLIERITQPAGLMIARYAHLLETDRDPTAAEVAEAINPNPKQIIDRALSTCMACHEDIEEDESLPKLYVLIDEIAEAERYFVQTANRLDEMSKGVLLVENQRFKFEDAKTHLIALSPLQHTLDNDLVAEKVAELNAICDEVNAELDQLDAGLAWRGRLLTPVWIFAVVFAIVMYVKYKQLKAVYVQPEGSSQAVGDGDSSMPTRRGFLDVLVGAGIGIVGVALAVPSFLYLWPAAKGGAASSVEIDGASSLAVGDSKTLQVAGKPVIVVRGRSGFRAFDAACTHLGCLVKWDKADSEFKCPCHAAVFSEDGAVVSGPPPSPLPEHKVKEVGDKVFVTL